MRISITKSMMFFMVLLALVFSNLGITPASAAVTSWVTVGSADFSAGGTLYTSLAIYNGTPYVAYEDWDNSRKATVMKYDGSNWVTVGSAGFSADEADYTSLAFDGSGTPYVAYEDYGNGGSATVMKYDGSNWVTVGSAGFSSSSVNYISLAIYNGTPYVAYTDWDNGGKATVMKYDALAGNWVTVGSAGFSAGEAGYTSLAFDGSGTPYVAYEDGGNYYDKATVMKYDALAANWVTVGSAGFSAGQLDFTSLAFNGSGTPYVAYIDYGNGGSATVMKYDGSNWVTVGSAGFSSSSVNYISLAIYNGTPYVAYMDYWNSTKATVMKYNGSNWVTVGSAGFSTGQAKFTSLAFDGSGTPYVAYTDYGNGGNATVMKYTTCYTCYTVHFDANAGTGTMNDQTASTPTALKLNAFIRTGYTFKNWNTKADGSGTGYANSATYPFTADATLYAQWTICSYTLTYTAGAHGFISGTPHQILNYGGNGTKVTAVPALGYHFMSWSDGVLTASRIDTYVTKNISVIAYFALERTKNGGFNGYIGTSNIPQYWTASNFKAVDGKDKTVFKEGTASVKITGISGVTKTLIQTLVLGGSKGDRFLFSFQAKGSAIPSGICMGQVNINTASVAQLYTLPGIGPVTAQSIVTYRQQHGPFKHCEDIMDVPGIGPATFDRIRNFITVGVGGGGGGVCMGQVKLYSDTEVVSTQTITCATGTYGFQLKTLSFTAPSNYTKVVIVFTYKETGGTVWFDAVSLLK